MEAARILAALSLVGGALGWALPPLSTGLRPASLGGLSSPLQQRSAGLQSTRRAFTGRMGAQAVGSRKGTGLRMSTSDDMEAFVLELQVHFGGLLAGCVSR